MRSSEARIQGSIPWTRIGKIGIRENKQNDQYMKHKIEYLKDVMGSNYLGIVINPGVVSNYMESMKEILGDEYQKYIKSQIDRDGGKYHITVINVMEFNQLTVNYGVDKFVNSLDKIFDYPIDDVKFMGLGKAEKSGNKSYFVVIKSDKLDQVRDRYNLEKKDFHITLGFFPRDVHGVRKNEVIKQSEPFVKLLAHLYYKSHETFDFIKKIDNYEYDSETDIEPIKIEKSTATFRSGENNYFQVAIVDSSLRIVTNWQDTQRKPKLSNTIISRNFKKLIK